MKGGIFVTREEEGAGWKENLYPAGPWRASDFAAFCRRKIQIEKYIY